MGSLTRREDPALEWYPSSGMAYMHHILYG